MSDKDRRQALLAALVRRGRMRTQRDLLAVLRSRGFRVDQSTLSRDLGELGVRKSAGRYVLPGDGRTAPPPSGPAVYAEGVRTFTTCGPHLIVIHTVVGQAQAVAVAMDAAAEPVVAATLAGDDTVFVATKNRRAQVVALRRLQNWFGDKHEP